MTQFRSTHLLAIIATFLLGADAARAGDVDDHERAREALESGKARSLSEVLDGVRSKLSGEVVGVEIEREKGRYIYEFKVIAPSGRMREIHVDALTLEILKHEDD
jgi:uncharacterized membrane protein YkoI